MKYALAMWAVVATAAWSGVASAEPGLGGKVYDPYVLNGVTELELRGGSLTGGSASGASAGTLELEHGLNDRVSVALLANFVDEPGSRRKLDAVALESVVYLGQIPKLGVDAGLYFEYGHPVHGGPDTGEMKLLLAKNVDRFQGLLNLVAERPLSGRNGVETEFSYAASATWQTVGNLRLGAEAFGDLGTDHHLGGRQAHYVGPVAHWSARPSWLPAELEVQVGYLFAAGAARDYTDGQTRLLIALERRF